VSVTTGAWSPRRYGPLAERIAADLLAHPGTPKFLAEPSYRPAVDAWASAEAICQLLREWLAVQDIEAAMTELTEGSESEERDGPNVTRSMRSRRVASVLDQLHRHETRAMHLRVQLGLSPLSRARLGKDVTSAQLDLARMWAEEEERDKAAAAGGEEPCRDPGRA